MADLYKKKDYKEAKNYVTRRLYFENELEIEIRKKMQEAINKIVEISYRYNIRPKDFRFSANQNLKKRVNEIIAWLRKVIFELIISKTAAAELADEEEIQEQLLIPIRGKTLRQRIEIYTERFKYEIEAAVAASLILGHSKRYTKNQIYKYLRMPYNNPDIKEAIKRGSASATRLVTGGVSYGAGHSNAMYNAITLMSRHSLAYAWMWMFYRMQKSRGVTLYAIRRGSTYPCAVCDLHTTYIHVEGNDPLPPFHPHCVCIAIPITTIY